MALERESSRLKPRRSIDPIGAVRRRRGGTRADLRVDRFQTVMVIGPVPGIDD